MMKFDIKEVIPHLLILSLSLFFVILSLVIGDLTLVEMVNLNRPRILDPIIVVFTNVGDYLYGFLLFLIFVIKRVKKEDDELSKMSKLAFISWILLYAVLTTILKVVVARPRPYVLSDKIEPLGWKTDPYQSFPSGHTVTAFTFTTSTVKYCKSNIIRALSIIFAVLMGFSRLYCGVHFLTDVIAGALIGIYGVLTLDIFLLKRA